MKRLLVGLFLAALALSACSNGAPATNVNGKLSANTRAEAAAFEAAATTRVPRSTTTRRPTRPTRTTRVTPTSIPQPTQPTQPSTPPTFSRSGVAGAVLYETNYAADRPCSLSPGPAKLHLLDSDGHVVVNTATSEHGSFVIEAAPGNYTLVAKPPSKQQRCAPVAITIPEGQYATVQVRCGAK